jgi:hypothetical protein
MLKNTIDLMQPKRRRADDANYRGAAKLAPGFVYHSFLYFISIVCRMPARHGYLAAQHILITKASNIKTDHL